MDYFEQIWTKFASHFVVPVTEEEKEKNQEQGWSENAPNVFGQQSGEAGQAMFDFLSNFRNLTMVFLGVAVLIVLNSLLD